MNLMSLHSVVVGLSIHTKTRNRQNIPSGPFSHMILLLDESVGHNFDRHTISHFYHDNAVET